MWLTIPYALCTPFNCRELFGSPPPSLPHTSSPLLSCPVPPPTSFRPTVSSLRVPSSRPLPLPFSARAPPALLVLTVVCTFTHLAFSPSPFRPFFALFAFLSADAYARLWCLVLVFCRPSGSAPPGAAAWVFSPRRPDSSDCPQPAIALHLTGPWGVTATAVVFHSTDTATYCPFFRANHDLPHLTFQLARHCTPLTFWCNAGFFH